jgi:cytochrome c1
MIDFLTAWIENPQALKPGAQMGLSGKELNDLVAYPESLK